LSVSKSNKKSYPSRLGAGRVDKVLGVALVLGLIFGLNGIQWGWVECWNPDQMAFRDLFQAGKPAFEPPDFQKPPFHTYFNFFLSSLPFQILESLSQSILHLSLNFKSVKLFWSRLLTVFLFLGSIALVFYITKKFFGLFAARIVTIIFATSAGFIVDSHYLTADIPVLFWMLVAFYFSQNICLNGQSSDYALAGFFTGIATATKYNGLAVGIAIVAAHILGRTISWTLLSKQLFLGLAMVVVGFLVGNPFAVLDYSTFIADFRYNYLVTPVYDGNITTEHSYWKFFSLFTEIIGFPGLILFTIAFLFSFYFLFSAQGNGKEKKGVLLLLSVFLLYSYKFGSFPRLEVRFVMPIVPFWLMISGPFFLKIHAKRNLILALLLILVTYNSLCSLYVGKRFAEDPRMSAQEWVKKNILAGNSIEDTNYTPNWNVIPGVNLTDRKILVVGGRRKIFEQIFKNDPWMMAQVRQRNQEQEGWQQLYSLEQLIKRQPDYVALDSLYYDRFFVLEKFALLYPSVQQFFRDLLAQRYPYKTVFDQVSQTPPPWLYPRKILFVDNRITLLKR